MSPPFGFVVLNYLNFQETIDCVDSILALPGEYRVVVVDNLSPNDSHERLVSRFCNHSKVVVLQAGHNGGYSAGNNVGIRWLRGQGIDDVVIATSDTRVDTLDLIDRFTLARDAGAAVVGPYIRGDEPGSQNPILTRLTLQYIAAIHLGALWTALKTLAFRTLLRHRAHGLQPLAEAGSDVPVEVYMVHGCFLYLSPHYFKHFPLLDEDLFMYGEEDLIAFNCIRRRLRVVYDPLIRVYHGIGKSTSPDDFRRRVSAVSMAELRRKMSALQSIYLYVCSSLRPR